jgi:putative SOS response-associated peptidase YedK
MCGRFTLTVDPDQLREAMPWLEIPSGLRPRYNIAPSQPIAVVANNAENRLDFFAWGLIPSWAKDTQIGNRMINARAETLSDKPSFRNAYRRKRCLILADGFYEWKAEVKDGKQIKIPMYIRMMDGRPFAFAGLWDLWNSTDGSQIYSATIITTEPNEILKPIHNRMPVILPAETYPTWLTPSEMAAEKLQHLLKPYPPDLMTFYPVSRRVNDPANDNPDVIQPDL